MNNWKDIKTAPVDVIIQVKKDGHLPVTAMIHSKYSMNYPILVDETGKRVIDSEDGFFILTVDYWRELAN